MICLRHLGLKGVLILSNFFYFTIMQTITNNDVRMHFCQDSCLPVSECMPEDGQVRSSASTLTIKFLNNQDLSLLLLLSYILNHFQAQRFKVFHICTVPRVKALCYFNLIFLKYQQADFSFKEQGGHDDI